MDDTIKKKMYFFNVGVKFDIHDKKKIYDVWNCNGNCCKSDLANGLSCENWGVFFNKKCAEDYIKNYVKVGVNLTYGYINEIEVEIEESVWKEIKEYLIDEYHIEKKEINKIGFIPWDFAELLEDICPFWKEADTSYYKNDNGEIEKNVLHICEENKVDKEIMNYINNKIYRNNCSIDSEVMDNNSWIDFLSGSKVIKVTNENEYEVFKKFMEECGLLYTFQGTLTFKDWQYIARKNERNENIFLFEYNNYKGLTFSDNIEESIKWFGDKPIETSELNNFFKRKELDVKHQTREKINKRLQEIEKEQGAEL